MARENQWLQIFLIIFVILTILLAVTTFLFYRQYQQEAIKAKENLEKATTEETAARNVQTENNELKRMMGFAPTDKLDTIQGAFNKDMQTYAATVPEANWNYHFVVAHLHGVVQTRTGELATQLEALQGMKRRNETLEAIKQKQIDEYKASVDQAVAELSQAKAKFTQDLQEVRRQSDDREAKVEQIREAAQTQVAQFESKVQKAREQIDKLSQMLEDRNKQVFKILRPTFEAPDGEVRLVNNRNRTVWIDLGYADGLRRQMTFSVYPAETNDINRAGKKAEIEVIQLIDDHLAEARIVEDDNRDPILIGDVVYTPVWAPGERLHFALTDSLDVDNDGKYDPEIVRNLIAMNGAVIDDELVVKDDGTIERTGALTTHTRFVVLGTEHDSETPEELINARVAMLREAETLGIQTMPLPELLRQMGWKNQTPVVVYGEGARREDFRAPPPEGVPRVSSGTVSPLFKPREPVRSAY